MFKVGKLPDGRFIGEKDGRLFYGTERLASYDELDLKSVDGNIVITYKGEVIGRGTVESAPGGIGKMEKQYRQVLVVDGKVERTETREKKIRVVDWSPA